jgi:hypothetical protein
MSQKNPQIGTLTCAFCGRIGSVRKNSAGKLYYLCNGSADAPGCGMLTPNLPGGQAWVRNNMTATDAAPAAAPAPAVTEKHDEKPPQPAPEKKLGLFESLLNARVL